MLSGAVPDANIPGADHLPPVPGGECSESEARTDDEVA